MNTLEKERLAAAQDALDEINMCRIFTFMHTEMLVQGKTVNFYLLLPGDTHGLVFAIRCARLHHVYSEEEGVDKLCLYRKNYFVKHMAGLTAANIKLVLDPATFLTWWCRH